MLINIYRKPVQVYVIVYYKPSSKSYYHEIDYHRPRREIGETNGFGHEVVAVVNLSEIFFKRRFVHRRNFYVKLYRFLERQINRIDKKENDYHNRFIDHT